MKQQLINRLCEVERRIGAETVVLVIINGVEHEMGIREYEKSDNAHFQRIISGGRIKDIDVILDKIGGNI
jgi:ketopantoate reductase